jgi:hypothetical protein
LAKLLILADQIGYIVLDRGERRRLWSIAGGNKLEKALLYGFHLTSEGDSPSGRAWLEQKFGQIWGFRFQIT